LRPRFVLHWLHGSTQAHIAFEKKHNTSLNQP
jgi:hypothetical protein